MSSLIKRKNRHRSVQWFCIIGLTPIILLYSYVRILPIFKTVIISFFEWDLISVKKPFVGFSNFIELFQSQAFLESIKNTTFVAFGIFIFSVPLGMLVAIILHRGIRFKSLYEAIYFLPYITPMVPAAVIWKWILDADTGLLNYLLSFLGVAPKAWLLDPKLAIVSVIMITVWKTVGYNIIIFSVGLTGISPIYYEAAAIDGVKGIQAFRYITLPLLKPITVFVSIVTLIHGFNVFSQVYILASDVQGSPGYVVRVLVYDIIENGFRFYKMGYASAEATVLFLIVLVLTAIQLWMAKDRPVRRKGVKK